MENKLKITFGLPCYNVSRYVEKTLESIYAQNISVDFEVVFVDDCSTDNTYEILKSLEKKYKEVSVYKNEKNQGVSQTRNRIIELAKGEYIWFVDPDDLLFFNVSNHLINLCDKYDADYICGNYVEFPCEDIPSEQELLSKYDSIDKVQEEFCINMIPKSQNQYGAVAASVLMGLWKRSFLQKNGIVFNSKVSMMEDMLFKLSIEPFERRIVYVNYPVYIYLIRGNSATTSKSIEKRVSTFRSMCFIIQDMLKIKEKGDCAFAKKVDRLILQTKEQMAMALIMIDDLRYFKSCLKEAKSMNIYPYEFRKTILTDKNNMNFIRRINLYLLPFEPVLWLNFIIRKVYGIIFKK